MTSDKAESIQEALVFWFQQNGRDYPWRRTRDPYAILVSELMLQQTRIATVLDRGYYENWMSLFPDCKSLAAATEPEILKAWEGLGYYNRARNLQRAAQTVVDQWGGSFPDEKSDLLALPGVGPYTAGAVLSFAFGKRAPIVDGNVIRVLSRLFAYDQPCDTGDGKRQMWAWAEDLTPETNVRDYNSGIMELGQNVCHKDNPSCLLCPVSKWCAAFQNQEKLEDFPKISRRAKITRKNEQVLLMVRESDRAVFLAKESGGRRRGLWKLPEISSEALGGTAGDLQQVYQSQYAITRYRVDLRVFRAVSESSLEAFGVEEEAGGWFSWESFSEWPPLGAPYLKALHATVGRENSPES